MGTEPQERGGCGITWEEFVLAFLILVTLLAVFGPVLSFAPERSPSRVRAWCQNNLKQWGMVYRMYASENKGLLPPIQTWIGPDCLDHEHGFSCPTTRVYIRSTSLTATL